MEDLIRLSKADESALPLKKSTLRKWKHLRKHPELFVTFGSTVFVDLQVLKQLIEAGRGSHAKSGG
jgi:hypothetical protein